MTVIQTIREVQSKLGVEADGNAGPKTWAAIHRNIVGDAPQFSGNLTPADTRSEQNIETLLAPVQPLARALIESAADVGITIKVISGTRSYEQQSSLYEQGRSKPGKVVTNARPGSSWHNHGVAFDIGIFQDGKYVPESSLYKTVSVIGKSIGLEWGGDWKTITDEPHYQLTNGKTLAKAIALHEEGRTVFS